MSSYDHSPERYAKAISELRDAEGAMNELTARVADCARKLQGWKETQLTDRRNMLDVLPGDRSPRIDAQDWPTFDQLLAAKKEYTKKLAVARGSWEAMSTDVRAVMTPQH